jgi:hypothetical protein
MLNPEDLTQAAIRHAQAHAQRVLNGDLMVTAAAPNLDWDAHLMRHTHHQALTLWRKYGRFDIILDASGTLIGFIDHDKFLDPGDREMTREDAEAFIRKEAVVPESSRLESFSAAPAPEGPGRIWKAVFALAKPEPDYELLDVELNAAKRAVISVRPKRREGRNA